jgi:hypothetical protein
MGVLAVAAANPHAFVATGCFWLLVHSRNKFTPALRYGQFRKGGIA